MTEDREKLKRQRTLYYIGAVALIAAMLVPVFLKKSGMYASFFELLTFCAAAWLWRSARELGRRIKAADKREDTEN